MNVNQRQPAFLVVLASLLAFVVSAAAHGDEPAELSKAVQGKWVRHHATANGPVTIVKEHTAHNTIVTAYDDKGNIIYSHASTFTVAQSGKVCVFTFFDRTITIGPHAGQTIKEPVSFVYRVAGDRFIEVYGILDEDANVPNMIIWDRLADDAKGEAKQP